MDRSLVGLIAALTILCGLSAASHAEERGITEQAAITTAMSEPRRQAIMAANVALSDAEGAKFWPLYRDYRVEVAKINEKVLGLISDFAKNYDSLTDAKAESITADMLETKKQRIALMSSYVAKYAKVLGHVKTARVMQIESKLDALVDVGLAQSVPLVQP
jgi:hypothetical protein